MGGGAPELAPSGERAPFNQAASQGASSIDAPPLPPPRFDTNLGAPPSMGNIVERRPSFKVRQAPLQQQGIAAGALTGARDGQRRLRRVASLEEQVAKLAQKASPAYRWPATSQGWSRPSANVR
jgi:hypothetical protein